MSTACLPNPDCIEWPQPPWGLYPCDPCINVGNPDHQTLLEQAWAWTVSYIGHQTGHQWVGQCWEETYRPYQPACVKRTRGECGCCVGPYRWLPLDQVTCFPILDVARVEIGATGCNPHGQLWLPGNEIRVEWVHQRPRLAIQDSCGCCGPWPKQNLCRVNGDPCTWSVTFLTGCNPPSFVVAGAAAFTVEWVAECIQKRCTPANWASKSFDGTTVNADNGPPLLALRVLDQVLTDDQTITEHAYCGGEHVTWHSVGRPTYVGDCDVGC